MSVKNVSEWLDNAASKYPDKVAFSNGKLSITFSQLQLQAKAIGCYLISKGLFKSAVAVIFDKDPRAIVAFLGCAYSGNFYVPIDPVMPKERLDKIKETLGSVFQIDETNYSNFVLTSIDNELLSNVKKKQIDTDLLYLLFTSGSTGAPKGVAKQHRAVIDYSITIKETFGFDENTVHGQAIPLFFDSSILPIYQTIMNGGTDYLIPQKTLMFPQSTIDFLNEYKCNAIYWVPTSYNIIAKSGIFNKTVPKYITKCLFVGEIMPVCVLNIWRKFLPEAIFANLMGPTEIAGTYLYYIVDRQFLDDEQLPLGHCYKNIQCLLLNENDVECKVGEIGELCVRGGNLAYGYYNDLEKTKERFVQNPLNKSYPEIIYRTGDLGYINNLGEYMFAGRKDFQIKLSGHRIELEDIEITANSISSVELCGCVFDEQKNKIVLFYQGDIDSKKLKSELKMKLQLYMVPSSIVKLEEIPKTGSGKINRVALKKMLPN